MNQENAIMERTIDEISASIRAHAVNAAMSFIAIGHDLIEAKEKLGHGRFLPWLKTMGIASSTANNYMALARQVQPGSLLSGLPYSKAMALLALPENERETFARENQVEDKSAAEIKRLILERDQALADREKAIEAANIRETQMRELSRELEKAQQAEPVTVEKIVEVQPADYAELKRKSRLADQSIEDAMQAAIEAENRANALQDELSRARSAQAETRPRGIDALADAVNDFLNRAQRFSMAPDDFRGEQDSAFLIIQTVRDWCDRMESALDRVSVPAEAVIE